MSYLVKVSEKGLMIDDYAIGHAPKDPSYRYINLFVTERNIRSIDIEAMFGNLSDGIEIYKVEYPIVSNTNLIQVDIPKFTDDFTMFKEDNGRYVIRLVEESDTSKQAKDTAKANMDNLEALVYMYEQ